MKMAVRCLRAFWTLLVVVWGLHATLSLADDFLPPEKAFVLSAHALNGSTVRLHWDIAPGYHLYRDRVYVSTQDTNVAWSRLDMPKGESLYDDNFKKTLVVYQKALDVDLQIVKGGLNSDVEIHWQGCAEAGLCYPPTSLSLQTLLVAQASDPAPNALKVVASAADAKPAPATGTDAIAATLASGSWLHTVGVFWLAGLLLAFTPCVLPMVPILSSLIAGQAGPVSRGKGFGLALAYSLGMALIYAGFGVAAGLAGEGLAAALQNPWVLGAFALMLSVMALSMFGLFELQMPSAIQSRATEWSNRFQGGSFVGVFVMGGISALVVGPCVAAPLAGALVYISQTRDVVLGGSALFAMALGMSVPLLLVGVSAGSLLPRAGAWMEKVKQIFGMMLLGVAIWMVSPVIPDAVHMVLWSVWLLTAAALLGIFGASNPQQARTPVAARASGAGLATLALLLLIGAASGGQSVLQPLAHLRSAPNGTPSQEATPAGLKFTRVSSMQALDASLQQAQQQGQAVMLDFYADWCVACKEFERFTFSDPAVQKKLSTVRLLQADVTANNSEDKAMLKRFELFGPPGIVFFDSAAGGGVRYKVVGYQSAPEFLASLDKTLSPAQ